MQTPGNDSDIFTVVSRSAQAFLQSSLEPLAWKPSQGPSSQSGNSVDSLGESSSLVLLTDETLSANLVYQDGHEIGSTTPSDEAMAKTMTMMMAW